MVEHGKPAPDVYEYACSQIGLAPEECMAVEDSPNGIKSACAAGCKVVMVPDLTQPDEEIKDMLYACVPTLMDLKQFILVGEDISGEQQICLSGSAISD